MAALLAPLASHAEMNDAQRKVVGVCMEAAREGMSESNMTAINAGKPLPYKALSGAVSLQYMSFCEDGIKDGSVNALESVKSSQKELEQLNQNIKTVEDLWGYSISYGLFISYLEGFKYGQTLDTVKDKIPSTAHNPLPGAPGNENKPFVCDVTQYAPGSNGKLGKKLAAIKGGARFTDKDDHLTVYIPFDAKGKQGNGYDRYLPELSSGSSGNLTFLNDKDQDFDWQPNGDIVFNDSPGINAIRYTLTNCK